MVRRRASVSSPRHRKINILWLPAVIVLLGLVFFASCGEEPSGAGNLSSDDNTGTGDVDVKDGGDFLLAAVEGGEFAFGRIELWGFNLGADPNAGNVAFDAVIVNASDSPIHPPIKFVVTSLHPYGVTVVNPDGYDRFGHPYFDFSNKLGDDGVLSPQERSGLAHFVFHTGVPRSFIIGYRFDFSWEAPGRTIGGIVFHDINQNGMRDRINEPGIPGIPVSLESKSSSGETIHMTTRTDSRGEYYFTGLEEGVYSVSSGIPPGWVPTSPNPVLVTLIGDQENMPFVFFGLFNTQSPAEAILFGRINVGPRSPYGTVVDSTFVIPVDSIANSFTGGYYLGISPPMVANPLPLGVDTVIVRINQVVVYEYYRDEVPDSTMWLIGVHRIPETILHPGKNQVYMEVKGKEWASLIMRIFSLLWDFQPNS